MTRASERPPQVRTSTLSTCVCVFCFPPAHFHTNCEGRRDFRPTSCGCLTLQEARRAHLHAASLHFGFTLTCHSDAVGPPAVLRRARRCAGRFSGLTYVRRHKRLERSPNQMRWFSPTRRTFLNVRFSAANVHLTRGGQDAASTFITVNNDAAGWAF